MQVEILFTKVVLLILPSTLRFFFAVFIPWTSGNNPYVVPAKRGIQLEYVNGARLFRIVSYSFARYYIQNIPE